MENKQAHGGSDRPLLLGIMVLIVVYALATAAGLTVKPHGAGEHATEEVVKAEGNSSDHAEPSAHGVSHTVPHLAAVVPFVLLLGAIAIFPVVPALEHWWESNLHRLYVAGALAIVTLIYYLLIFSAGGVGKVLAVLDHGIMQEYVPFIVLLFSLYTISGGIRIQGDLPAHSLTNSIFLVVGGLLASFIGTTGAAMLLIRPLLETNAERKHIRHTVVFFIFVVCNCGGCLLPIGDPPLFLGYLKGVDFLWTMWNLWQPWLLVNAVLIGTYYLLDRFWFYPREAKADVRRDELQVRPMTVSGLWPNALLLVGVVFSVALLDSTKTVPGTDWHPWLYLREIVQFGLVALSLYLGSSAVRKANSFNYHAILEVAALFVGIFVCMQPAIEILHVEGPRLGIETPSQFFWATGGLSSVLDNAPTYVVFFETADASFPGHSLASLVSGSDALSMEAKLKLIGISLGAVFMGAMTYIGNGPNFMVRAIAEQSGVRMPSFFGYVFCYSLPILVPIFFVATLIFLYGH